MPPAGLFVAAGAEVLRFLALPMATPEEMAALTACRYGLRSPFSQERLSRAADGRVIYALRRPWPRRHPARGARCVARVAAQQLRRLAAA